MDIYLARQPILNRKKEVIAYELLYRGKSLKMDNFDGNSATLNVINNTLMNIGFEDVIDRGKAFLNFTGDLIKRDIPQIFNNEKIVVEILEYVEADDILIEKIVELKKMGYTIALDDFILEYKYDELIELADIIKVDFLLTDKEERIKIIKRLSKYNVDLLAEKVESESEFLEAKEMNFKYFQGYFFEKPKIIESKDVKSLNINHLNVLDELRKVDPDYDKLTEIIKKDFSMTYKFLKLVNSVGFYSREKVESLNTALVRLGFNEINKYIFILMLQEISVGNPEIVIDTALVRAKFCENLAKRINRRAQSGKFFLVGMFSLIDVILNKTKDDALENIPIANDIKFGLTGEEKNDYYNMLELIEYHEHGEFEKMDGLLKYFDISLDVLNEEYINTLKWKNELSLN